MSETATNRSSPIVDIGIPIVALAGALHGYSADSFAELANRTTISHNAGGFQVAMATLTTLVVSLLQFAYKIHSTHRSNVEDLGIVVARLEKVDQLICWLNTFVRAHRALDHQEEPLLKEVGDHCLRQITTGFEFRPTRIVLDGEFLAYESYRALWERINKWQCMPKKGKTIHGRDLDRIEVVAVHSSAISVWNDVRGKQFLKLQSQFTGSFTRILVGNGPLESQTATYLAAARNMIKSRTRLYYTERAAVAAAGQHVTDFLYLPQFSVALQWLPYGTGRTVRQTRIVSGIDAVRDLADCWEKLHCFLLTNGHSPLELDDLPRDRILNSSGRLPPGMSHETDVPHVLDS